MSASQLGRVFEQWRGQGDRLVLATVYETAGSTYSKAGAQMIINANGDFQGMLSGGCLEGDLAERARKVAETGDAQAVTYDLGQNDDELWGLGVGCDGLMRIFLQPLEPGLDYQPLPSMLSAYEGRKRRMAMTIVESAHPEIRSGMCIVQDSAGRLWSSIPESLGPQFESMLTTGLSQDRSQYVVTTLDDQEVNCLLAVLRPIPRILVLGAGLDAEPVVRLVTELGWTVTVNDHRQAYIENGDFSGAESVCNYPAASLSQHLPLGDFDGCIVMSHHLVTDETYLRQLAETSVSYIGLLGPADRRQRLLESLGEEAAGLASRLYGPAGIDINAGGPASIALSIVAQLHDCLMKGQPR